MRVAQGVELKQWEGNEREWIKGLDVVETERATLLTLFSSSRLESTVDQ